MQNCCIANIFYSSVVIGLSIANLWTEDLGIDCSVDSSSLAVH